MGPRPAARVAVVAAALAWVVFAHHLAPLVSLHGRWGPALSPLLWAMFAGYAATAWALRRASPRLVRDLAGVVAMGWLGYAGFLCGGWVGLALVGALLPALGVLALAAWIGSRGRSTHPQAWFWAGVALCAPFVVLGPLLLRWLVLESAREWPVEFLQMSERVPLAIDAARLFASLVLAGLAGVLCLARSEPDAEHTPA